MNKNYIDEVLEEFNDKWKMSIEASGFMKNDRRGIEFYVVKEWLKQKLQQVEQDSLKNFVGKLRGDLMLHPDLENLNDIISNRLHKSLKTKE